MTKFFTFAIVLGAAICMVLCAVCVVYHLAKFLRYGLWDDDRFDEFMRR